MDLWIKIQLSSTCLRAAAHFVFLLHAKPTKLSVILLLRAQSKNNFIQLTVAFTFRHSASTTIRLDAKTMLSQLTAMKINNRIFALTFFSRSSSTYRLLFIKCYLSSRRQASIPFGTTYAIKKHCSTKHILEFNMMEIVNITISIHIHPSITFSINFWLPATDWFKSRWPLCARLPRIHFFLFRIKRLVN